VERIQQANRVVAAWIADVVGGSPRARRYYGDDPRHQISIGWFADRPQEGVTTYATLGLSDVAIPGPVRPPLGAELLGVCASTATDFPKILGEIAFRAQTEGRRCLPDEIFDNVVPDGMSATLRHAILVDPFLWDDDAFAAREIDYKTVAWLHALPITDAERRYARDHTPEKLQDVFEDSEIDIFDPQRPSAV
jgi:hypothetical protein